MCLQILWVFDTTDKQIRYLMLDCSSICFPRYERSELLTAHTQCTVISCKI